MKPNTAFTLAATLLGIGTAAQAAPTYPETFEVDPTSNWVVHESDLGNNSANFFFDYSTVSIPTAPSGSGTHGLKLQANLDAGDYFSGLTVSPLG